MSSTTASDTMTEFLPDFNEGLNIGAPLASKKGGIKQSYISLNGKPFIAILGSADAPLRCPFEVKPYNESESSTRLNLNLAISDPAMEEYFTTLDESIVQMIAANSSTFLGKDMPIDHIRLMYKQMLPDNEGYNKNLKVKVNLQDPCKLRAWNKGKQQVELPTEWKNTNLAACIKIKSVYSAQNAVGVVVEASDIMICENASVESCPF